MVNEKLNLVILANEYSEDHYLWIKACEKFSQEVSYRIVDLTSSKWLEAIQSEPFDYLLAKPGAFTSPFKLLYDERIHILSHVLGYSVFPSPTEVFIYENKRFLSFWLKANKIPHPKTEVFYFKHEADAFLKNCNFPLVAKVNIGASGNGVRIVRSLADARAYVEDVFSGKGAAKNTGPNLSKGNLLGRSLKYFLNPMGLIKKLRRYNAVASDRQTDFVLFQEFIPHDYEWRVVRIGNSFFAHKKMVRGEMASGSLIKGYDNPPIELFDFVKEITDKHSLYSQAIDIFESPMGFLVNEMQCIFGQSDPYQMLVDGKPGRFVYNSNKWHFEEGDFNGNESFDLRVQYLIDRNS